MRVAAIDTGTNSTRLLVADVDEGRVNELYRETVITRLGEGVDGSGRLGEKARRRVEACVERYVRRIGESQAQRATILATSSVRDSIDGAAFIASLAERYSLGWKVLGGEEEAGLSFSGASMDEEKGRTVLLLDIGGGSTEVVVGRDGLAMRALSLGIGCVRLTERFLRSDPPATGETDAAGAFLDSAMKGRLDFVRELQPQKAIAVAGTVTTIAALDLGLEIYDRDAVHGHVLTAAGIRELYGRLVGMDTRERAGIPVIEKGRADVIVAGILIAMKVLEETGFDEVMVSENDILDGAALAIASGAL